MAEESRGLRGAEFRKAVEAAKSGRHRAQRIRGRRKKKDPLARMVPGARVMPAKKDDPPREET